MSRVNYTEGLQVGYKWYDEQGVDPLFEFGHGLSYTDFECFEAQGEDKGQGRRGGLDSLDTVENTGDRAVGGIPQVYLTLPDAAAEPGKRLVGFDRIDLAAGEKRAVEVIVDSTASNQPYSIWDVTADAWTIVDGTYTVSVGSSSRDLPLEEDFKVKVESGQRSPLRRHCAPP